MIQDGAGQASSSSVDSHDPPHFWYGGSQLTRTHFRFHGCQVTQPQFHCCGCHLTTPTGKMTLPHHTREMPRPMQVIPIRVIKPQAKTEPAGIQDSTVSATSGLEDSREPPQFQFGGSHVSRPHFWFGGCHVIRPHYRFIESHESHPSLPVQRQSLIPSLTSGLAAVV